MGFKSFRLELEVRDDAPPPAFATAIPQMFEALLDVFAALDVTYAIDDGDFMHVRRLDPARAFANEPLWCDEELTRDALTRCKPGLGTDVVTELYDRFANLAPASFYISAEGALRHRAPGTDEPAWYGRWRSTHLHELYTFSFTWTKDRWRGFELKCPLSGYPFTSVRPLVRGSLADGDPAIAAENRALLFPALARVRGALGFDPHEVSWSQDTADYGPLFPDDARDITKRWLPLLAASLVLLFACKKPAPSPVVAIELAWPGASAEMLEEGAVIPVEQAVAPFARSIESRIAAEHAAVRLEVEDLDRALDDVNRAIPLRELPADLSPPELRKARRDDTPVMWLSMSNTVAATVLVSELERLPGVAQVEMHGFTERMTVVFPDLDKLDAFGVGLFDVLAALQSSSIDVPGGSLSTGAGTLRVDVAIHDVAQIGDLVVGQAHGVPVRLKDVARVGDVSERDGSAGPPMLAIHSQAGVSSSEVVKRVRAAIANAPSDTKPIEAASPLPPKRTPKLVVQLRGPDLATLRTAAEDITKQLAAKSIRDLVRDPPPPEVEQVVVPDRGRAAELGVSIADVMVALRAIGGTRVGPVMVRFPKAPLHELVERVRVRSAKLGLVPLSTIASTQTGERQTILRRDRERTIELSVYAGDAREIVKSYTPPVGVRVILSP